MELCTTDVKNQTYMSNEDLTWLIKLAVAFSFCRLVWQTLSNNCMRHITQCMGMQRMHQANMSNEDLTWLIKLAVAFSFCRLVWQTLSNNCMRHITQCMGMQRMHQASMGICKYV